MFRRSSCHAQRGFTLIEVLIVLMLTAIALLALGTFSLSVMDSGTTSRERLTAVHLAEQVIEEWQNNANDYLPDIASDCTMGSGVGTSVYPVKIPCVPAATPNLEFTIVARVADAKAPLPNDLNNFRAMLATTTYTNPPMVKLVTVKWFHKGEPKSIYLTHLTR